ncbi:MAG: hypothetical protein B7X39_13855 [Lysobacterales bacterium 14-68-21]|jgi:toxin CptA|nr:MAG: hypothetical protein B7X45_12745 [Xanthomonadales bacterium 15-68-25]OZB65334.1 MAG: hypothetical protein B7X39_13855 [Xanthomonadales bacterium 14-68-21]
MTSAPAIGFEYRRSCWLAVGVACMLLLALLAIAFSGLPDWGRLAVSAGAIMGVLIGLARQPAPPASVGWGPDAGWSLLGRDGLEARAELVSHRVLAGCLVLELRAEGRRQVLWLLPDNSDPDIRRRVRMRLAAGLGRPSPLPR